MGDGAPCGSRRQDLGRLPGGGGTVSVTPVLKTRPSVLVDRERGRVGEQDNLARNSLR